MTTATPSNAPANTMKLVIYGHSVGGEIWQTSHWCGPSVVNDPMPANNTDAATALAAIKGLASLQTLLTWLGANILPTGTGVDGLKLYCYPTGGNTAAAIAQVANVVAGSAAKPTMPPQCAVVASLKTDHAGRSARGRMYFPLNAADLSSNQLTSTVIGSLASDLAAYFGALKTGAITPSGSGVFAVIASGKTGSVYPITSVTVDSKVDTQRRRAMKIAPAFTNVSPVSL